MYVRLTVLVKGKESIYIYIYELLTTALFQEVHGKIV